MEQNPEETLNPDEFRKQIMGEVIYLGKGWGYINSHEIQYSKIYFHWTCLNTDTKNFAEITKGSRVKFNAIKRPKGWKAVKIEVL